MSTLMSSFPEQPDRVLRYDPVITRGLFQVTYNGKTRKYTGVSAIEAAYKFAHYMHIDTGTTIQAYREWREVYSKLEIVCIKPTIRQSDLS